MLHLPCRVRIGRLPARCDVSALKRWSMLKCPAGKAEDVVGLVGRREAKSIETLPALRPARVPWIYGRIVGQKRPRLGMANNKRSCIVQHGH